MIKLDTQEAIVAPNTERRERIATAALQGILACMGGPPWEQGVHGNVVAALRHADALIAELDRTSKGETK